MKKFFLTTWVLLASVFAWAESVPQGSAKAAAERFLHELAPGRSLQLQLVFEVPRMTKSVSADPAYYIFSDPAGGFVIAAGDDTVPAVLGYSTTGILRADDMPDNLKAWLDMWREIIADRRARGAASYQAPVRTKAGGQKKLLETALWGQRSPFNDKCYVINGSPALTGCTATATAIVMRYFQHPGQGSGTLPAYEFKEEGGTQTRTQDAMALDHKYNWSEMPTDKNTGNWTSQQKEQVAVLMRDLAVMLKSRFGAKATSAFIDDVAPGLVQYMNYDASARLDKMALYGSVQEWIDQIKANIDRLGPVVYAGYGSEGGHAFVVDGYDEQDYLHVNWGWTGQDNGFFAVPDEFDKYTEGHTAVLGLKKNAGGKAPEEIRLHLPGVTTKATITRGSEFLVYANMNNAGAGDFQGEFAIGKFDRTDALTEVVTNPFTTAVLPKGYGYNDLPFYCTITTQIRAGDYLTAIWRSANTPSWTAARYDHENTAVKGRIPVGDTVILEQSVSLQYDVEDGALYVIFDCECTRELRNAAGAKVTAGITDDGEWMRIDATQLTAGAYTLHLQRGEQVKDITLHLGLK